MSATNVRNHACERFSLYRNLYDLYVVYLASVAGMTCDYITPYISYCDILGPCRVERTPTDGVDAYYQSGTLWANTRQPQTR